MDFENFKSELLTRVNNCLPKGYHAEITEVVKNNNTAMSAMIIKDGSNLAPTLYFEDLYRDYLSTDKTKKALDLIAKKIAAMSQNKQTGINDIIEQINNFDTIKKHLCFKLINTSQNEKLINEAIGTPFFDLYLVVLLVYENDVDNFSSSVVTKKLAELWKVTESDIILAAAANSQYLMPPDFFPLSDLLPDSLDFFPAESNKLRVLTNKQKMFGAVCITYPNIMEMIAKEINGSYFIIPSSIHEIIIFPGSYENKAIVDQMINEVNYTSVPKNCYLNNHAYFYDYETQKVIY